MGGTVDAWPGSPMGMADSKYTWLDSVIHLWICITFYNKFYKKTMVVEERY